MHACALSALCCGYYAFSLRCDVMQCAWNGTLIAETEVLLLSGSGAGMSGVNLRSIQSPNCCNKYICLEIIRLRHGGVVCGMWVVCFISFIQGQGVTNNRESGSTTVNCQPAGNLRFINYGTRGEPRLKAGKIAHL